MNNLNKLFENSENVKVDSTIDKNLKTKKIMSVQEIQNINEKLQTLKFLNDYIRSLGNTRELYNSLKQGVENYIRINPFLVNNSNTLQDFKKRNDINVEKNVKIFTDQFTSQMQLTISQEIEKLVNELETLGIYDIKNLEDNNKPFIEDSL